MWFDDAALFMLVAPPTTIIYCPQCNHSTDDHDDYSCNWRMTASGRWEPEFDVYHGTAWGE